MGEMGALIAATRTCADLRGVVDRLGTAEVGKLEEPEGLIDLWELLFF